MVIDVSRKDSYTLESAYYDCIIECHDAISNGVITMLTESAGETVLTEGVKTFFKGIINSVINALRKLKEKIVGKYKELKAKFGKNKDIANKVDECSKNVEQTFEKEKENIESINIQDDTSVEEAKKTVQNKADKAAENITNSAKLSNKELRDWIKNTNKRIDKVDNFEDYRDLGIEITQMFGKDPKKNGINFSDDVKEETYRDLVNTLNKYQDAQGKVATEEIIKIFNRKMDSIVAEGKEDKE